MDEKAKALWRLGAMGERGGGRREGGMGEITLTLWVGSVGSIERLRQQREKQHSDARRGLGVVGRVGAVCSSAMAVGAGSALGALWGQLGL